ncbi:MAG TPA: ABC transporter permease [Candidatus Limnocylindrales bacterium]
MTTQAVRNAPGPGIRQRVLKATPYLFLIPGLVWLFIFFVLPTIQMFTYSVSTGSITSGFKLTWTGDNYITALSRYGKQFGNSLLYGGAATVLTLLIGFPVAYTVAFKGGRYKNLLLFLVIAPFFTSFLIRTISWKILLGDEGPLLGPLKDILHVLPAEFSVINTPISQLAGLTYNFLPFMILPLYVALEKIDPRLIEAANDLYASNWQSFRRVTLPLALPGVFAGTLLTFIPAMGDYVNAELLGNPQSQMIGNVIQNQLITQAHYPIGSALSFILMTAILVAVAVYARVLGTEQLTG